VTASQKNTDGGMRHKYAVIVAGGKGVRMGNAVPKQYLTLAGKPVLYYAIHAFLTAYDDIKIILVYGKGDIGRVREVVACFPEARITLVDGGESRFHSVRNGLAMIEEPAVVFVHDGVRPLVSQALIHACYHQALEKGSAIPALPLKESIRRVVDGENFSADRTAFRNIQTPQTFLSEVLLPAFNLPFDDAFTDEASVVERSGVPVHLIDGEPENIKITRPEDLWLAEQWLHKLDHD
jgi:2-C-methyl-D-erythritol 4-phosphate cytidylyltransferase